MFRALLNRFDTYVLAEGLSENRKALRGLVLLAGALFGFLIVGLHLIVPEFAFDYLLKGFFIGAGLPVVFFYLYFLERLYSMHFTQDIDLDFVEDQPRRKRVKEPHDPSLYDPAFFSFVSGNKMDRFTPNDD